MDYNRVTKTLQKNICDETYVAICHGHIPIHVPVLQITTSRFYYNWWEIVIQLWHKIIQISLQLLDNRITICTQSVFQVRSNITIWEAKHYNLYLQHYNPWPKSLQKHYKRWADFVHSFPNLSVWSFRITNGNGNHYIPLQLEVHFVPNHPNWWTESLQEHYKRRPVFLHWFPNLSARHSNGITISDRNYHRIITSDLPL